MNCLDRAIAAAAAVLTLSAVPGAATQTYRIDPAASRATIHVGKAGPLSFVAGHTHQVSGPIRSGSMAVDLDAPSRSHIRLVIATSALRVSADGEPEGDAPKVQEAMDGEQVLDVARYPQIVFESTSVALENRRDSILDVTVTGRLTIRDTTREIAAPVHVELQRTAVTASGRFTIKQSSFGIKPVSVGGVVAVKDTIEIEFSVSAHE